MRKNRRIFLQPPYTGRLEREAVKAAFASGYIAPCGPQVEEFERRLAALAGRRHAVAVSSGTAAIELLLAALGVDERWTVIAATLTFIATVGPAWRRGAKLALVDSAEDALIDPALLERALAETKGPKAVIPVDLYGRVCDYPRIARLCRRYDATLLADAAEAVGSRRDGRPAGSAGLAAVYSFNGNKCITTSGGGAVLTDSKPLADAVRRLSTQSREPVAWYEHREVGYNCRMSNLLGAIGVAQLDRLPEILEKKRRIAAWYGSPDDESNHWLNLRFYENTKVRDAVIAALARADIEARPVWKPMHLQPVFRGSDRVRVYGGEVAKRLFETGVCLPSGAALRKQDVARIIAIADRAEKGARKS